MDLGLKGKTVVVTGGSSGIGLATVRAALQEGANVALCARGAERLSNVAADLSDEFGSDSVLSRAFSVLEPEANASFAADVAERFGACDALVTNAGQGRVSTYAETTKANPGRTGLQTSPAASPSRWAVWARPKKPHGPSSSSPHQLPAT